MASYLLQVTIGMASNLSADYATNTWSTEATADADAEDFKDAVVAFYEDVRTYFPNLVRQNDHVWKIFDRGDIVPRQPVSEGTFNLTAAPTASPLPTEASLCLSFQGNAVSGQPQARRRGRIYLGPLGTNTSSATGRPGAAVVTAIAAAGGTLLASSIAAANWNWVVHSNVGVVPDVTITNGWVDDEYDTQRRRGRAPTSRTVF